MKCREGRNGVYLYVIVQETDEYYRDGPGGRVKARLERASGERCLIVPYQEFNMGVVEELGPRGIVMSGFGRHFRSRKVEWFHGIHEVLHTARLPMLCICGSHQLLGFSFNKDIRRLKVLRDEPMRRIRQNEDLPRKPRGDPEYDLSGFFVADGFFPIRRLAADPLFDGLPRVMVMKCSHYCEVKRVPRRFKLLAGSGHCRIEAMRHQNRPLYGVQFHPESYEDPFLHGRKLLENFAVIVKTFWQSPRQDRTQ